MKELLVKGFLLMLSSYIAYVSMLLAMVKRLLRLQRKIHLLNYLHMHIL